MSNSRIISAVLFKVVALGASLVNVTVAGIVLEPNIAILYLAMLSTAQIMIPFAGLGIGQKLVTTPPKDIMDWRLGPWFLGSTLLGIGILCAQYYSANAPETLPVFVLCIIFLTIISVSELVRSGFARQTGFKIYNFTLLFIALFVFVSNGFTYTMALLALCGLAGFIYKERAVFFSIGTKSVKPNISDLGRAFRVLAVNQYYNVLVVLLSLFATSPELLAVVVVWRFNIFFNWQTFYWLRFGQKDLAAGVNQARLTENKKVSLLNIAACALACTVAALANFTNVLDFLSATAFDTSFFKLLAFYAVIRTLINIIFPYEIFAIYNETSLSTSKFFLIVLATFSVIIFTALIANTTVVLLLVTECGALLWRLSSATKNVEHGKQ